MFQRLHFVKMLKIEKFIESENVPMSCYGRHLYFCNAEEPRLEAAFLQHSLSLNNTKNSHPFLVFQRLNFVKTLKFEKVIEI